ncbi:family 43 glycosylhydrolase [Paradesertivirga mongoliensis]|uniref:Family 43 glycosylhydrolase n=1 Tax=Paradesertivirga mongoliensis TaxID=2100740 RepID=A0ABW4ZSF6_9SPHI|nr:family 43 glycosylhydrolase [Pedobacter mongoliensis]
MKQIVLLSKRLQLKSNLGCIILLNFITLLIVCSKPLQAQTFQNPVRAGAADPAMVYYNGFYYLTFTNGNQLDIVKSATIAGLATAPPSLVWTDGTPNRCCYMWAPDLKLLNKPDGAPGEKRWYLYYSAADAPLNNIHRNYVLESSGLDPLGPYTFKGKLAPLNEDARAIDANILVKDDGSLYYLWSSNQNTRISIATMSNPWTVNGNKVILSAPTYGWEMVGAAVNENPATVKRNGKTFLTYSASTCFSSDYTVGMLVNTDGNYMNPGSWTKLNYPVFAKASNDGVYGPGGSDFFKSPDGLEDWIVYHATTNPAGECGAGRSTRIQKITWDVNDNPIFGMPASTSTNLFLPSGDVAADPANNRTIISGLTYKITRKGTPLCLDVANNSSADGANVGIWNPYGSDGQKWVTTLQTDGTYKLLHKNTNQVLSSEGNSAIAGANVVQSTEAGLDGQRWNIQPQPNGFHKLVRKGSSLCLDVANNSSTAGANVGQWHDIGVDGQRWKMEVVGEVISGATYKLLHKGTNQYLASYNNSSQAGADVVQATGNGDDGQQWVITLEAGGFYKLKRKNTSLCLDVANNSSSPGADVGQWLDHGGDAQRWNIVHVSDGYFKLVHKGTTQCLDVAYNSSSHNANVGQWNDTGLDGQRWRLELVSLPNQGLMASKEENMTLGIEPSDELKAVNTSLNVYPNPLRNTSTITFLQDITGEASVALYNLTGKRILSIFNGILDKNRSYNFEINKEKLDNGYYIIKAWNKKDSKTVNLLVQ